MTDRIIHLLDQCQDRNGLSRYIEPHLPLLKSRPLYHLYLDLRYDKGLYRDYIPLLVNDSKQDYRLETLLGKLAQRLITSKQ